MKQLARSAQAGFTLIELMVSLLISSLMVAMIMQIFIRMSGSYRTQQQVSEVQQVLAAAGTELREHLRLAGFQVAQGFQTAAGGANIIPPIVITNSNTGPDSISLAYADASAQAKVTALVPATANATTDQNLGVLVDSVDNFNVGDIAVMVNPTLVTATPATSGNSMLVNTVACVVQIASVIPSPPTLNFSTSAPWGNANNPQCAAVRVADHAEGTATDTMIYRFAPFTYRIDPTRPTLGVLQVSPTGGTVANDFQDLAVGFTDLQIASRYWGVNIDPTNLDHDNDPNRIWYSGGDQTTLTAANPTGINTPIEIRLSFSARTNRTVDGVATAATPALIDITNVGNNTIGDNPSVQLLGVPDASRPAALAGDHIYRFATIDVDMRNLGVGR